jgi:hypothetical protein
VELLARNTGDVWDSGKVIIQPRQTGDARDLIVTEPSEQKSATSSLCRITLSNGRVLSVFARDGEVQVQAPSFSGDAQLVVTLESAGGIVNGLVIKGREAAGSHAFDARPSQTAIRTPILSPSNFKWIQSASEISPSYSDVLNGQNHSGDSAPKR